jgi:hypothetical protein
MAGIGAGFAGLELAGRFAGVTGFFKRVPRWVWVALAIAAAVVALLIWHGREVAAHDKNLTAKVIAARDAQWQARFDAMRKQAEAVRSKTEAAARKITQHLKDQHDEALRSNAAAARDLSLRGPGKAAAPVGCGPVDRPGVSAGAGDPVGAGGTADIAASSLPPRDRLALVPWSWLVDQAQHADDSRAEVITWRNWYIDQAEAWEKYRASQAR